MDSIEQNKLRTPFFLTGFGAMLCYLLSFVFPEKLWAIHSFTLLPNVWRNVLLIIVALLFTSSFWRLKIPKTILGTLCISKAQRQFLFVLISIGVVFLCINFPLPVACYGDSIYIKEAVDITIKEWDDRLLTELISVNFLDTKIGLNTYYHINNFFTWLFGVNGTIVALWLNGVVGGVYALLWMKFCDLHLSKSAWKILFMFVGLSAPIMVVFMGHYETYAFSYTAALAWISALGIYFKTRSVKCLIALPILFIFILQTHITYYLLIPSLLLSYLWHFRTHPLLKIVKSLDKKVQESFSFLSGGFNWFSVFFYVFVPMVVVGAFAYFFVFSNYNGPRKFSHDGFENALFLPLYTDEAPPYDRYNMLDISHLLDYFNVLLMFSGALLMLLIPALTFLRKKVFWNDPLLIIVCGTSIIYCLIFFCLNPLLGLPVDWDLFATPGVFVLSSLVLIYGQLEKQVKLKHLAGPVIALCLLGGSFMVVNAVPSLLSKHLLIASQHNYKTYWIGSSTMMISGINLGNDAKSKSKTRKQLIHDLEPYAVRGNDNEYGQILLDEGEHYFKETKDFEQALIYFKRAEEFAPRLMDNINYLALTHFELKNYQEAFFYADRLVKMKYTPYKHTLKMAIRYALVAQEYQNAANYSVSYLNNWQDDQIIDEVEKRLRTGDRIHDLYYLFN